MRRSEFIVLEEAEKKHVVLHQGVLIAKRKLVSYMVFLFQMENYYIETFCNLENKAIDEYRVFDNPDLLRPYLDLIPIRL